MSVANLPALDVKTKVNHSPHVVILGSGASLAAFPRGDKNGRLLPVMQNLTQVVGLESLLRNAGVQPSAGENFEQFYDRIASAEEYRELREEMEAAIRYYFAALRLPETCTLYDKLLGTLRPKDLIATFNWDPFLLQAYARNRDLAELPRIVFLHGNVYLGYCPEHRVKGYATQTCSVCRKPLEPSPLLFPIRDKSYRDHSLLAGEWDELERTLEYSYLLTIFGYSAPTSDAAARDILLKAWNANGTRELAEVQIVDILPKGVLHQRWNDFIVRQHYGVSRQVGRTFQFQFPRRSCEALAWATLQLQPWATRPLPHFRRLDSLKTWLRPLIDEEIALNKDGRPFEPFGSAGQTTDTYGDRSGP
jgi:hypothetical protein